MDALALRSAVVSALRSHTTTTGIPLNVEWLEIVLHPTDEAEVLKTINPWTHMVWGSDKSFTLDGIKVRVDANQPPGHPLLRSTWEYRL